MANIKLDIFANLDLQGEKVIRLGPGEAGDDAVTVDQLTAATQAGAGFQQQPTGSGSVTIPIYGGLINSQETRAWLYLGTTAAPDEVVVNFSAEDSLFTTENGWLELTDPFVELSEVVAVDDIAVPFDTGATLAIAEDGVGTLGGNISPQDVYDQIVTDLATAADDADLDGVFVTYEDIEIGRATNGFSAYRIQSVIDRTAGTIQLENFDETPYSGGVQAAAIIETFIGEYDLRTTITSNYVTLSGDTTITGDLEITDGTDTVTITPTTVFGPTVETAEGEDPVQLTGITFNTDGDEATFTDSDGNTRVFTGGTGAGFQRQGTDEGTDDIIIPVNGGVITTDGTQAFVNISTAPISVASTMLATDFTTGWLEITEDVIARDRTQNQEGFTNTTRFTGRIEVRPLDLEDALLVSGDGDNLDIGIRRTTTTPGKIGSVEFEGDTAVRYAEITGNIENGTDGSEDGSLDVSVMVGGTPTVIGTFDEDGLTITGDITLTNVNSTGLVDGIDVSGLEFDPLGTASGWTQAIGEVVAWEDGLHSGDPYQGQVDALVRQSIFNYNSSITGGRAQGETGFTAGADNEILISNVEQDTLVDWVTSDDTRLAADRIGYVHIIPLEGNPAVYVCRVNTAKTEAALRNFTTGSQTFAAPNTGTNTTYTLTDTFTNIISVQVIGATTINLTPQSEYTVNGQEITILINITDPAAVVTIGYNEQRTVPTAPQNTTGTLWDVVADFSWKAVPSFAQNDDTREVIGITTSSFIVDRTFSDDDANIAELVDVRPVLPHIDEDFDLKLDIVHAGVEVFPGSDNTWRLPQGTAFAVGDTELNASVIDSSTGTFTGPASAQYPVPFSVDASFAQIGNRGSGASFELALRIPGTDGANDITIGSAIPLRNGALGFHDTFELLESAGAVEDTEYDIILKKIEAGDVEAVNITFLSLDIHESYEGVIIENPAYTDDLDSRYSGEAFGTHQEVANAVLLDFATILESGAVVTIPIGGVGKVENEDIWYYNGTGATQTVSNDTSFVAADGWIRYTTIRDAGGAGTVDTSGNPEDGDIAVFTDEDTIEGSTISELGITDLAYYHAHTSITQTPFVQRANSINSSHTFRGGDTHTGSLNHNIGSYTTPSTGTFTVRLSGYLTQYSGAVRGAYQVRLVSVSGTATNDDHIVLGRVSAATVDSAAGIFFDDMTVTIGTDVDASTAYYLQVDATGFLDGQFDSFSFVAHFDHEEGGVIATPEFDTYVDGLISSSEITATSLADSQDGDATYSAEVTLARYNAIADVSDSNSANFNTSHADYDSNFDDTYYDVTDDVVTAGSANLTDNRIPSVTAEGNFPVFNSLVGDITQQTPTEVVERLGLTPQVWRGHNSSEVLTPAVSVDADSGVGTIDTETVSSLTGTINLGDLAVSSTNSSVTIPSGTYEITSFVSFRQIGTGEPLEPSVPVRTFFRTGFTQDGGSPLWSGYSGYVRESDTTAGGGIQHTDIIEITSNTAIGLVYSAFTEQNASLSAYQSNIGGCTLIIRKLA